MVVEIVNYYSLIRMGSDTLIFQSISVHIHSSQQLSELCRENIISSDEEIEAQRLNDFSRL